jgi:hypothetical protein
MTMIQTNGVPNMSLRSSFAIALGMVVTAGWGEVWGEDSPPPTTLGPVVRIEQDWELIVNEPDDDTASPQVATQMNLDASGESFAIFAINFQQVPSFWPGGMEIQLWDGEEVIDVDAFAAYELSQINESIRWTQVLEIKDGKIRFYVKDGNSESFGSFGGTSFAVDRPTNLANLDQFQVEDTLKNSGVLLGANRVNRLVLKETRFFDDQNQSKKDDVEKVLVEEVSTEEETGG